MTGLCGGLSTFSSYLLRLYFYFFGYFLQFSISERVFFGLLYLLASNIVCFVLALICKKFIEKCKKGHYKTNEINMQKQETHPIKADSEKIKFSQ